MSYFYKTLDYITHISADFFHLLQFFRRLEKWNQKKLWSSILAARKWTSTVPLALVAGLKALALPCISAKETLS